MQAVKIIVIFVLFINLGSIQAQNSISGFVLDENNQPLEFCNVLLLNNLDSYLIKGEICDKAGKFIFQGLPEKNYLLKFSFTGFNIKYETIHLDHNKNKELCIIVLASSGINMDEIVLSARRPFRSGLGLGLGSTISFSFHYQSNTVILPYKVFDSPFSL